MNDSQDTNVTSETPQIKAWSPSLGLRQAVTHVNQLAADFRATSPFGRWSPEWRHHLTGYLATVIDQAVAYGRGIEKAERVVEEKTEWRAVEPTDSWPSVTEAVAAAHTNVDKAAEIYAVTEIDLPEEPEPVSFDPGPAPVPKKAKKSKAKKKAKKAKQVAEISS